MKEWLKVRWIFIGLAVLHGAALLITYYDLLNTFKIYKANEVVIQFITFEVVFYSKVKYVSLLTGLGIGIFQFFPELNQSRLKLTLHLPVKENRLIFQMAATGQRKCFDRSILKESEYRRSGRADAWHPKER